MRGVDGVVEQMKLIVEASWKSWENKENPNKIVAKSTLRETASPDQVYTHPNGRVG